MIASPAMQTLNHLIEKFDQRTKGLCQHIESIEGIVAVCIARGWHDLAYAISTADLELAMEGNTQRWDKIKPLLAPACNEQQTSQGGNE